jgi:hypothetical protein
MLGGISRLVTFRAGKNKNFGSIFARLSLTGLTMKCLFGVSIRFWKISLLRVHQITRKKFAVKSENCALFWCGRYSLIIGNEFGGSISDQR